ncbi:hypothetical protein [Pedobacter antarcticus]|uniref:AsmA-like C-terminal domain-containing protein n=2 Tax=Pedobacter antarcticus TaxID=34086 RepID=A0A081PF76_9SPHI|nr:hypothetical protein [Pedobacter antarcticus]KEQ29349.1 hypothetical protein N180_07325 [Pedobacter antarcticus 4BY]SDL96520.1 hypothetical protein SAMN04488084_10394 [Pedobacter antarcticus]SFE77849.1 hypothetical protein SAMN03003324_01431 [Pedobacter antarcticus]
MNEKSRKTISLIKWIVITLFLLFALADAASWLLAARMRPAITRELKDLVLNSTDSLYSVKFSRVNTNFLFGNASVSDVEIIPDTVIYNKLVRLQRAPNNTYAVTVKKLTIRNFHPYQLWKGQRLRVDQLLFEHPKVVMTNKQLEFNEDRLPRPYKSPYAYISQFLKEISVQSIDLKDISFSYVNKNGDVPVTDSLNKLNISLKDWLIDAGSATDPGRFYLLKDVWINLSDYKYATPDSLYHIELNELSFRSSTGKLNVRKFGVIPRYGEMEFARVSGFAKDRFSILLNDIDLKGIDLPLYVRKQELLANEMNISNGYVSVFNNNELPSRGTVRMGKFPHQLLQSVKGLVTIHKLTLANLDLSYAEYDRESKMKGKITFENTSGTLLNVTNEAKAKAKNPVMQANLRSDMMGQGRLIVDFRFDLLSEKGAFSYKGELGHLDGPLLNRITKPLGMLQVKSGVVRKLSFDIAADENQAKGKLNFAYNDLSVTLLKKVEGKDWLVKQGLISMLANAMVINADNPDSKGNFITAKVDYKRNPTHSFFSFIWQSLFQGIKYTVGLSPQKQAEINKKIQQFEKLKTDRELRRQARERRKRG